METGCPGTVVLHVKCLSYWSLEYVWPMFRHFLIQHFDTSSPVREVCTFEPTRANKYLLTCCCGRWPLFRNKFCDAPCQKGSRIQEPDVEHAVGCAWKSVGQCQIVTKRIPGAVFWIMQGPKKSSKTLRGLATQDNTYQSSPSVSKLAKKVDMLKNPRFLERTKLCQQV